MIITELENGDLKLELEADDAEFIHDMKYDDSVRTELDMLHELTEGYWTNGSYEPFDASDGNPFVGLTDAPCIAESMDYLDDGTKVIIGNFWYYSDYMIKSFIDELLENSFVIFTLAAD